MSKPRYIRCAICDRLTLRPIARRVMGRWICRRHAAPELDIEAMTRA